LKINHLFTSLTVFKIYKEVVLHQRFIYKNNYLFKRMIKHRIGRWGGAFISMMIIVMMMMMMMVMMMILVWKDVFLPLPVLYLQYG